MKGKQAPAESGDDKDLSEYKGDEGLVLRWLKELSLVKDSKRQKTFEEVGDKIVKKYKNQAVLDSYTSSNQSPTRVMFNVLWSNVQILKPALCSRIPKIYAERRFKDSDPIGRLASLCLERATTYAINIQQDRAYYAVKAAVEDRLLPGRGNVWLRYDAQFDDTKMLSIGTEKVTIDPLFWKDYFESNARNPYEVRWRARRSYMTREQLVKRFGEIGKLVQFNTDKKKNKSQDEEDFIKQAEVFEIWDETSKSVIWIAEGYKKGPLDYKQDILKLNDFWPCPMPLTATVTTDSTYPTPDYIIYERLADELDSITKRLSALVECVRLIGVAAARFHKKFKNIMRMNDGELFPIDGWAEFMEKGGLRSVIDWLPFDQVVAAIPVLQGQQQALLAQIFEVTGIPDIARGNTDPNETAAAQQRKSHWTVVKIVDKQQDVQRFWREIISKIAQIIFEPGLFSDETLALMCGVQQMTQEEQASWPQALGLLRDDRLRTFRIDIETDSTIANDEDEDKASRMELLQAISQIVSNIQNVSAFRPELMTPIIDTAMFAVRGFRTARSLEGTWDKALTQIEENDKQAKMQPPPPPPPDPNMLRAQADMQRVQMEGQNQQFEQWLKSQELQLKYQAENNKFQIDSQKLGIDGSKVMSDAQIGQMEQDLKKFEQQFKQFVDTKTLELEQYRVVVSEKEKVLEEARLQGEQELEIHRLAIQSEQVNHSKKPKLKKLRAKYLPDGTIEGESQEVSDPGAA